MIAEARHVTKEEIIDCRLNKVDSILGVSYMNSCTVYYFAVLKVYRDPCSEQPRTECAVLLVWT